jgi:hypothetical protein
MRFVNDDGKSYAAFVADLIEDKGEFLHRRDDDLLAFLDESAQITRSFRMMSDSRPFPVVSVVIHNSLSITCR